MHKSRKIVESFNCAIEGIIEALKNEAHMRVHFYITITVLIVALFLDLTKLEIAILSIAITVVWVAELINTAVEAVVDIYSDKYHDLAKLAKDTAAGGVFVASVNAIIIGYLVFYNHFEIFGESVIVKIKRSQVHTSIVSLILVVIVVVGLKAYFRSGKPLQGGMPSGHSALAFGIWMAVLFISDTIIVVILSLLLAGLVAQTRVKAGIHNFFEIAVGGFIGAGIVFLMLSFSNFF